MDEYDEGLLYWFDNKFWPMVAEEHYYAQKMAEQQGCVSCLYWQGYFEAMDMISCYIDESMERIRAAVEEEECRKAHGA